MTNHRTARAPQRCAPRESAAEVRVELQAARQRCRELEDALRGAAQWAAAQWKRAVAAERELAVQRAMNEVRRDELLKKRAKGRAVVEGKAEAHRRRLFDVACKFRNVEKLANGPRAVKKSAAVKDELGMSLPTYRTCVAEIRERAEGDPELAAALRALGFE